MQNKKGKASGNAQSPVIGSSRREEITSVSNIRWLLFSFVPVTRYSINVRWRLRSSKHIIIKEGEHLIPESCLDYKILQCPDDLGNGETCAMLTICIDIVSSSVGYRVYLWGLHVHSLPVLLSWLCSLWLEFVLSQPRGM